jgi:capsular polysaccharide biosynthesis protein/Mrp family chromosome partitioning ATPase
MRAAHLKFIRRWWLTLLLAALVAGLSGFVIAERLPATYQAEARILVGPISADRDVLEASSRLVRTYAELASSRPVQQEALDAVGSSRLVSDFAEDVQVRADGETRILTIQVRDGSPEQAADLANAMAAALEGVDTTVPRLPEGRLSVVQTATPPVERFGPQPAQVAVLAALAGFIAAVLLVIGVDYLSDYVTSPEDLPEGVKLLGVVPNHRRGVRTSKIPVQDAPQSNAALLYQLLARRVTRERPQDVSALVIAGVGRAEAAGEVAANLGLALKRNGQRVRLLDVDGDRHVADNALGGDRHVGRDDIVQHDLLRRSNRRNVRSGVLRQDGGAIGAQAIELTISKARVDTDVVLIVPPPLASSPMGWMWSQFADAVILVAQAEQTGRRNLDQAVIGGSRVGARIMGVVLREHVSAGRATSVDKRTKASAETRSTGETRPTGSGRSSGDTRPSVGEGSAEQAG